MSIQSRRSVIRELHQHDPHMTVKEMARRAGCEPDYVYTCLSQLGLKVGHPWTDREVKTRNRHNVTQPFTATRTPNQFCQRVTYQDHQLNRCMAETKGHTYCPDCTAKRERVPTGRRYMKYWGVA